MTPKRELAGRDETAVEQVAGAPAWLVTAAETDTSTEALKGHLIVPELRVVPSQPKEKMKVYKAEFGEGALVITPAGIGLAPHDTWVKIVPLFAYTKWRKWCDQDDPDSAKVLDESTDPTSELAKRSKNEATRTEAYGDLNRMVKNQVQPFVYSYTEHLHFVVMVYDGEHRGTAAVMDFSRGSFWKGEEFSSAMMMRKVGGVPCPLWTQVWEIQGKETTGKGYTWWAFDYRNPGDGTRIITDSEAKQFMAHHEQHKDAYKAKTLTEDLSESDAAGPRAAEAEVVDDGEM